MIQGVLDLFPEKEELGIATISHIEFDSEKDPFHNLRSIRDDGGLTYMANGKYVRLHINGELVMSDTRMEKMTNQRFIWNAQGRILIAGLGIGLVLKNLLINEKITEVVIIEKYQDVIDLVMPKFKNPKFKVVCADIWEWLPEKDEKFDTIYFDIWPNISTDNYKQIKKLHAKFRKYKTKKGWINSWMREYLIKRIRAENREEKQEQAFYKACFGRKIELPDL